ncbi:MAG: aminoacyl-tRNA hydrolase [Sphingobacteriaceae bacterium]|nr:aminoacyl-tRNA hydrolase [Sphingobacteriaceae bacterium]
MSKFLIVGLGNIGEEYAETRHNIGFKIADQIANEAKVKFNSERLADVALVKHKGKTLMLIKPTTFMNLSGKAVNYWLQEEKIKTENMLVLVDELALPFGKIRIGPKGSDGGHNGLKNIQETLNTTAYPRLRFGIANEFGKGGQVDYVLGKWGKEELKTLDERIKIAADAVKDFAFIGLQRSMNIYNVK